MITIDLDKSVFANEAGLKEHLAATALSYASQMNKIEKEMYNRSKGGEFDDPTINSFDIYKKMYLPIFESFASDKKRVYGGQASSYGFPSKYDGVEEAVETIATLKNKNRAKVHFKTKNRNNTEYLFVLIRKADKWTIDSAKSKWADDEKWDTIIM